MAEALAAAFTDNLLTCSICLEEYEDPRLLPCYHTFCHGCICDHAKRTSNANRTFLCPVCREEIQFPIGGLTQLKKNFVFSKAKDIITQQQPDRGASESEQTNVAAVTQATAKMTISCEKHPDLKLKYYCEDDDTVVCGDCVSIEHYRHGIVPVENVADINRKKIKTFLEKTLPQLNIFKEAVAKETATEKEGTRIMAASINKIKEQSKRIQRLVAQREQILISELNSATDVRKKQKGANKDFLELHHASLRSACNFAQELITNGSDSEIMIHTKALTRRLAAMEKMPVPTPDTPAQISYSPGKISTAGLEAMLGQVTVRSQPPRLPDRLTPTPPRQRTNVPNPALRPPDFLDKAECVHNFTAKLKTDDDSLNGLAIDEKYMFIVTISDESKYERLNVYTHKGQFKFAIKPIESYDVAVSQTGQLYVTSSDEKCVKVYSTRGKKIKTMGCGILEEPYGITMNRQGHVMVCDSEKKSIFTFNADSEQLLNTIPLRMCECPQYIAVNIVNDNTVVSDWDGNCVHVLSPTGDQLYQYGSEGRGDGQLRTPCGVCTDSYGQIFIADSSNHRIVALDTQGQFVKYIATEVDGLESPTALAINPAGQLVVAEEEGKVKTFQYLQ